MEVIDGLFLYLAELTWLVVWFGCQDASEALREWLPAPLQEEKPAA